MTQALHKIWWLWLPVLAMAVQVVFEQAVPDKRLADMLSESGPLEMLQFLIITAALFVAALTLVQLDKKSRPWLGAWLALAALCSLYVAGEEISWGQHILNWSTPEYWAALNDQGETNLHNTSSWLDQKPRLILLAGVIAGGLVIPALQRFRPALVPQKFAVIYPPAVLGVTAFFALALQVVDKIDEQMQDVVILHRSSEVQELYLFYFVLLYLIVLRRRVLQQQG